MKEILARNEEEFAEEIICKAYGKISGTASVSFSSSRESAYGWYIYRR